MSIALKIAELRTSLPKQVELVAVSKTRSDQEILEAFEAGQLDFGENYVQELVGKQERLPKEIRWHFIGHLQSNKVKMIAPFVHLVHGVDTLKLAAELDRQAARSNRVISFLFQIHIASEETKFGLSFDECENILRPGGLEKMKNVSLKGLMGMASNTSDMQRVKDEFTSLKNFHEKMEKEYGSLPVLSMGMSEDYRIAIDAGSNMVRIGSAIFGPRNYNH